MAKPPSSKIWGVPEMGGTSKSSISRWDFPQNTPSSYGGTPMAMETHIIPYYEPISFHIINRY